MIKNAEALALAQDAELRAEQASDIAERETWLRMADHWYAVAYGDES
jgi:hypothetical protein